LRPRLRTGLPEPGIVAIVNAVTRNGVASIRMQRKSESLAEAVALLAEASRDNNAAGLLLVRTQFNSPDELDNPLPDEIGIVDSASRAIHQVLTGSKAFVQDE
jgi:hypothetical protein